MRTRPFGFFAVLTVALAGLACARCGGPPPAQVCQESPGVACVWAGTGELGFNGQGLNRLESRLYWPIDIEFSPADGAAWVLDWNNHMIRRVRPDDDTFELVVGEFVGDGPLDLSDLVEPGAPGDTVSLNHPTDIQFLPDGRLIFAAWHNHKIRRVDPATGLVFVLGGRGAGYAGDGGPVASSLMSQPKALTVGPDGSYYILDQRNFRVRRVAPDETITTVVGQGMAGYAGDGGPPADALLNFEAGGNPEPSGAITLGPDGRLYVADGLNHRIRSVDFTTNVIETIAGDGTAGDSGDGGPAASARVNNVRDLEFGPDGRLYFADSENHRIRAIDLTTGIVETVVGTGVAGDNGDGHLALDTQINRPWGIAFDRDGNLFVADTFNSRILKVTR